MSEAAPRPWRVRQTESQDWVLDIDGIVIARSSTKPQAQRLAMAASAVNACHALNVQNPVDLEPQVRALVNWVRMYIEQDGFVTLEQRDQARALLAPFKEVV